MKRKRIFPCLAAGLLILFGCSAEQQEASLTETGAAVITIDAVFEGEDETPLSSRTVRISDGENSVDYSLDKDGVLKVAGLPRERDLTLSVLDGQEQQGTITLSFSQGSVIDVVTDADGIGHITLKDGTEEISLRFILCEDESLQCALRLAESHRII